MGLYKKIIIDIHHKTKQRFVEEVYSRSFTIVQLLTKFIDKFSREPDDTLKFLYGEKDENEETNN